MHFQLFSDFIGSIYDTVVDANACPTMLNGLADLLGATSGTQVGNYDSQTHIATMLAPRVDRAELHTFSERWANIWGQFVKSPIGAVIISGVPLYHENGYKTRMSNGLLSSPDSQVIMGATLLTEGPISTVVSVSRPYADGEFDATQIQLFAALIPHLQRAMQLRLRLATLDGPPTSSVEMLNRLPQAVLLVDAQAQVIFANQIAEKMLGPGGGLSLDRDGLKAETSDGTRLLRQTIANCADSANQLGEAGGRLRLSRRERAPLTMLVIPHRTQVTWIDVLRPAAILFITDPEQAVMVRGEWLRQDFGLTPAEAVFAAEISKGDGLQATASRLGVSLTTVRTHLAHVFDKTGTRRQAELVRLMLQDQPATRADQLAGGAICSGVDRTAARGKPSCGSARIRCAAAREC
ncbi:MAG: helix-turn-helix transcriptional regulator [Stellaceae bacterium]